MHACTLSYEVQHAFIESSFSKSYVLGVHLYAGIDFGGMADQHTLVEQS